MAHLAQFPWANTARVVALRFREDRLGQTAGSLTFTTLIALVPFVTVALAVFTVFPMFSDFQAVVQKRLVESLVQTIFHAKFLAISLCLQIKQVA